MLKKDFRFCFSNQYFIIYKIRLRKSTKIDRKTLYPQLASFLAVSSFRQCAIITSLFRFNNCALCAVLVWYFVPFKKEIRKKNIFPLFFVFVFSFWFHVWIRKNFFAIYWTMLTELVRCTINNYETNWHHYLYIFYFLALISAWLEYLQKKFRENNERLQLN